jgi:ribose transport system permease protein
MKSFTAGIRRYLLQLVVLVGVTVSIYALYPDFHVEASLERIIPLGVIAAGLAVTMIAGEFDLSIASMAALAGALTIVFSGFGLIVSSLIAVAICVLIGMLQGWAIATLGINSLVFTVGTLILIRGLVWVACGGVAISDPDITASDIFLGRILFLSPLSATGLLILIALGVFLSRTKWGRELYALGSSRHEAIAAGVRYRRGMIVAFGISAGCGAVGGALTSALSGSASPGALAEMLVAGLAAVLVGGVSLSGGRGTMINVFLGFAILAILASGLSGLGAQAFVSQLFTGLFLLVIVLVDYFIKRIAEQRARSKLTRFVVAPTPVGAATQ